MLVSLNWIRDCVDLPETTDARALAERFSVTTAEVDDVHEVRSEAKGLRAARIQSIHAAKTNPNLQVVVLELGRGETARAVSNLKGLAAGQLVLFAPGGAHIKTLGTINRGSMGGEEFDGLIVPAEAIGIENAAQDAIHLSPEYQPGESISPELFDDWLIEIDNKSLTNRPDLWGHYGIAREIAAIVRQPLKPYLTATPGGAFSKNSASVSVDVAAVTTSNGTSLAQISIVVADAKACPRYSVIAMAGVTPQAAPLWMQLRLGRIGMRPISGLVDLTNYIMADVGQPMHAFDASKVPQIEVDWAKEGEKLRTLDGVERTLTSTDLIIKCSGRSVALAGVMGGLETEVTEHTTTLLLESANFDGATVRQTAKRLNLRSEASARFEKSLDPQNTIPAIKRFIGLARTMYPKLQLTSALSDAFPSPARSVNVTVKPSGVRRTMGRDVTIQEARERLTPLGFTIEENESAWSVAVPTHRATGDIAIEADIIEELARLAGYGSIKPAAPQTTVRDFAPNALRELQKRSLEHFTATCAFNEIYGYIWYDAKWLTHIGFDPDECIILRNPAAEGMERLRTSLMPGLLAAASLNRFHFPAVALVEAGSVFERGSQAGDHNCEFRHLGLVLARHGKAAEEELMAELKNSIRSWSLREFGVEAAFREAEGSRTRTWEDVHRTAEVTIGSQVAGRISFISSTLRRRMDEHLSTWGIAWAEIKLSGLESTRRSAERLDSIPEYPQVEKDFSLVASKSIRYSEIVDRLSMFEHALLRRIRYVTSFEGGSMPRDMRSHTFRAVIGDAARTLTDDDTTEFQLSFVAYLKKCGYDLRSG
ncbi:MAG: phenylalanine--tRNA ligase subunit beta [Planctomycetes bacterium]|nr:phenylalanine--tRNA ligase subunit beta [Planctomycetota bacterium]